VKVKSVLYTGVEAEFTFTIATSPALCVKAILTSSPISDMHLSLDPTPITAESSFQFSLSVAGCGIKYTITHPSLLSSDLKSGG
jgi:hypothetical protein